jgi:hypothetical protein
MQISVPPISEPWMKILMGRVLSFAVRRNVTKKPLYTVVRVKILHIIDLRKAHSPDSFDEITLDLSPINQAARYTDRPVESMAVFIALPVIGLELRLFNRVAALQDLAKLPFSNTEACRPPSIPACSSC